jgi:predicted DNA-binding protein with PD1-like motif
MQHCETPFGHVLVLRPGDELIRVLTGFARQHDIDAAVLHGVGRVREIELGIYDSLQRDYVRREFRGEMEASSLSGNIALLDGEPFPYVQGVFSRADFATIAGRVFEAVSAGSVEIAILTAQIPFVRDSYDFCNLSFLQPERHA